MKVVYCAGPFRGPHGWAVAQNVRRAEELAWEVVQLGAMPLIPHSNTSVFSGTVTDAFWLDGTMELMRRCDALIATNLWHQSAGARAEIAEMERLGRPVFFDIDDLRQWLAQVETT